MTNGSQQATAVRREVVLPGSLPSLPTRLSSILGRRAAVKGAVLAIHILAARCGRSANCARVKRTKLSIPNPSGPGWTAEELELLGTAPDAEVAARTGRTEGAVTLKRCRLRIPTARDRRKPENR
jgi:hypothetical protein